MRIIQLRGTNGIQFTLLTSFSVQIQHAFRVMSLWRLHPGTVGNQLFAAGATTTAIRLTNVGHGAVYRVFPVDVTLIDASVHTGVKALGHGVIPLVVIGLLLVSVVHGNLPTVSVASGLFVMVLIYDAAKVIADHRVLPLVVFLDPRLGWWHSVDTANVGHGAVVPTVLGSDSRRSGRRHATGHAHVGHGAMPLEGLAAGCATTRGCDHAVATLARGTILPGRHRPRRNCLTVPT